MSLIDSQEVERAYNWAFMNKKRVLELIKATESLTLAFGSIPEDPSKPELFKGVNWKWFYEVFEDFKRDIELWRRWDQVPVHCSGCGMTRRKLELQSPHCVRCNMCPYCGGRMSPGLPKRNLRLTYKGKAIRIRGKRVKS